MMNVKLNKPYPKQLEFYRSKYRYTAYGQKPQWGFWRKPCRKAARFRKSTRFGQERIYRGQAGRNEAPP